MAVAIAAAGFFLVVPALCSAAGVTLEVKTFDPVNFFMEKKIEIDFLGPDKTPSLGIVDLGGDGTNEILIGAPKGEKPEIRIYREDGSAVNSFLAYDDKFLGGVKVGAGDLDGDGKDEIITVPASGAAAELKIFDGYGKAKVSSGFFAFDQNLKNGANLAVADVNNDGRGEIIIGGGSGQEAEIKIFKGTGEMISDFKIDGISKWSGVRVASGEINGDGDTEIVAAPGWGSSPEVRVFSTDGKLLNKFLVYEKGFQGGVNLAVGDTDNDGREEIVAGAGFTGGPHVRIFDGSGNFKDHFFPFDKSLRSGVSVSIGKFGGKNKLITMQNNTGPGADRERYKYLEIDISEQKLKFYENGFLLGEHPVSTGTLKMPTPLGSFKILSKSKVAYSNAYSLYMPNFMLFTKSGAGIHGLPYWKNGDKFVYEGVNHLGKRVSHGCVRLALDVAEKIFTWATVNTPVIVHQ